MAKSGAVHGTGRIERPVDLEHAHATLEVLELTTVEATQAVASDGQDCAGVTSKRIARACA